MTRKNRFFAAGLLLLAACAVGQRSRERDAPEENVVLIQVRNDLMPRTSVTVRIVSATGTRMVLGSVAPGRTRTLRFEEPYFESVYRLIAVMVEGNQMSSRTFELFPEVTVEWRLSNNTLSFTSQEERSIDQDTSFGTDSR